MTPVEQIQCDAFERFAALQRRRWVAPTPDNVRAAEAAYAEFERLFCADQETDLSDRRRHQ